MARRPKPPEDYTLFDIDPRFQEALLKWLSKKPHGVIVDIGPGRGESMFEVTCDPGGVVETDSFELALREAMGSKARSRAIAPELEALVHEFMSKMNAHITFGGTKDVFNVMVQNADATGKATDEDLELALVFAEEDFWDHMPAHPIAPAQRAELEQAFVPRAVRDEEQQEQLHKALFEPRPELEANRNREQYGEWVGEVDEELTAIGGRFDDAQPEYWRQLYQAGFGPSEAVEEFGRTRLDVLEANVHPQRVVYRWQRPFMYGAPPAPSERQEPPHTLAFARRAVAQHEREERPFDPEAPREHYAQPHHFAVNARWSRAYINSLPDSAFLYVEPGGTKDEHHRSHPMSLRHLPYKDRSGRIDQTHLRAALARAHQERTGLPKHVKDDVFRRAQAIYEREFGYGHEIAANR